MTSMITTALVGFFVYTGGATTTLPTTWATMKADPTPSYPTLQVAMTGYNAVPEQTDSDPYTTASGAYSDPDIIAARSRDLADELPFGTVIQVVPSASSTRNCGVNLVNDMIGLRVIGDTMNARFSQKIDILFDTADMVKVGGKQVNAARALGNCKNITIQVVGRVDPRKMPKNQIELRIALGAESTLAVNK